MKTVRKPAAKAGKSPQLKLVKGASAGDSAKFELLFDNASDAMMVIDLKSGLIANANLATFELTGYLAGEFVGRPVDILFPHEGQTPQYSHALAGLHLENNGFYEDIAIIASDGHPRYISLSVRAIQLARQRVAMCIMRDVAEKKKMERDLITKHNELRNAYISLEKANADLKSMQETLVQSGKLAALGELAAGIAHELNQPLTAVKGFAQEGLVAAKDIAETSPVKNYLDEIVQASQKMEKIISHLRNFTRKSTEDFKWTDVHQVIEESLVMLDKQFRNRGIQVVRKFDPRVPQMYCNPFQLEQVFINLATNARDAIETKRLGAGHITIETRFAANNVVEILYSDDGVGVPDSVKPKIFNPFFTTKEVGKGMGLGLSISYGILSKLNASILVESTMGKGTTFTIKLPVDYRQH